MKKQRTLFPFDEDMARIWADILPIDMVFENPDGHRVMLQPDSKQIIATAIKRDLALIEREQPYHEKMNLKKLNFSGY